MEESRDLCKRGSGSLLQKKDFQDVFKFKWDELKLELEKRCPTLLTTLSAIVGEGELSSNSKGFVQIMVAAAIALNGRNQEMSFVQYMIGFILTHGGCTLQDIVRLSGVGLSVHPKTIHRKLYTWQEMLDLKVKEMRESWARDGSITYQLIGDNWDKNILPSYRTSDKGTLSLHLFNVIAVQDRVPFLDKHIRETKDLSKACSFLPSIPEQEQLMKELTFLFATSIVDHNTHLNKVFKSIYPHHLEHEFSHFSGLKTTQYPLGLFDCNENKTQELIALLKKLSIEYVPHRDGNIVEPVFFGGDRLTDERVQSAQCAMGNANTPTERLEGFVSKIEDFHRLMNFLEAIARLTYNTESARDSGTVYHYRNLLNHRNVKGEVKNSYRPYKLLYYTIFDAICQLFLLHHFDLTNADSDIPFPDNFQEFTDQDKIKWLNSLCNEILQKWFFEGDVDIFRELREILDDPEHPENYWLSELQDDGRLKCHFCPATYAFVGSLKAHENNKHNVQLSSKKPKKKNIEIMINFKTT